MSATGAHIGAIHCMDFVEPRAWFPALFGASEADLHGRTDAFAENIWMQRQAHLMVPGYVADSERFVSKAELKRTRFWAEALRPVDICHSTGIVIASSDSFAASLTLSRDEARGPFEDESLAFLRRLAPHLINALALLERFAVHEQFERALDLSAPAVPVWLLASDGRVLRANQAASAVLQQGHGLKMKDGRILATQQSAEFQRALREVTLGKTAMHSLTWRHHDATVALILRHLPAPKPDFSPHSSACAVLSLHARLPSADARAAQLAARHGLSRAELRLALAFHRLLDVAEVAAELGISLGNARTTLKHVMTKTETRSQAQLALLLERALRE